MRSEILKKIISVFLPCLCYGCGCPLPVRNKTVTPSLISCKLLVDTVFCAECAEKLSFVNSPECSACGGDLDGILKICSKCIKEPERPWKYALSLMRFEQLTRELIHRMKFGNKPEITRAFGIMAAEKLKESNLHTDIIVPIPLHWTRYLTRGYNQADLFASVIAAKIKVPLAHPLIRRKRTPPQSGLTRKERTKNIKNIFLCKKKEICKKKIILLVDDVLTTGATLTSAAKTLLENGAAEVNICTIARG